MLLYGGQAFGYKRHIYFTFIISVLLLLACVRLPVMAQRGGEQRGADGLGVITARDEKERKGDNEGWKKEGRRGDTWKSNG